MKILFRMYSKTSGHPAEIIKLDNNKFTYSYFNLVCKRQFLEIGEVTNILYKAGFRY